MKRILKIIGIILLILVLLLAVLLFILSRKQAAPEQYWEDIETEAYCESRYDQKGPYTVSYKEYDAPKDERDSGSNHFVVWAPEEEGSYPLVIMVNGTGVPCNKYKAVFEHFASWGYVVAGNDYGTNWDGKHASETLDFALGTAEIAAMVDTEKIAVGGHSQGGMGTFNAITEYENGALYQAAFSISPTNDELAAGLEWEFQPDEGENYAFRLEEITIPVLLTAGTGNFDSETVSPLDKMQEEYSQLQGDKVLFRRADQVDHGAMLYEANGYILAWLEYYLKDAEENRTIFFGSEPELSENERYQDFISQEKMPAS